MEQNSNKKFEIRKGQGSVNLDHRQFLERAQIPFKGTPLYDSEKLNSTLESLWTEYDESKKWASREKAGADFSQPEFGLGVDWLETYRRLATAKNEHDDPASPTRILLINGSPRSDNTCPGEMSKTHRIAQSALRTLQRHAEVEYLDLSRLTSEFGKNIHPCKACVSTAMPLCHWPCSCYPNYALGQSADWMGEIYEMWMRAHGVMIITPVHWYSPTSVLKLMMDRMVCADGGNPDPTSTNGKDPEKAKELELQGWKYPKHLAGRKYSVVVHGDAEGVRNVAESIAGWLSDSGLESAGDGAVLDRYIGYYKPYATSHESLDEEPLLIEEVKRSAQLLLDSVSRYRQQLGTRSAPPSLPGLRRSQWVTSSGVFGTDRDVRPK